MVDNEERDLSYIHDTTRRIPESKSTQAAEDDNPQLTLAERYINQTNVSLFLTGKAGTGKTTFLRHIVAATSKRCVVVAPTGVAAVNAGGVTIHSFFQLPFDPYLPDVPELRTEYQMPDQHKQLRKSKQKIVRTLDLLIIDEISMVRADLLDAVDATLRRYRRSEKPFGGVQLLMIGDVQQLPPVVTDNEAPYLSRVYASPFFFHAKALQRLQYMTIQLTKIYRQQDLTFINILNNVRDGHFDDATLKLLNSRLQPNFEPGEGEDYIRLTTHNSQADSFNQKKLMQLSGKMFTFQAKVEGNFPTSSMPTEQLLQLKVGAQVMFVKNDSTGQHRYYNGKIGIVEAIDMQEGISVVDNEGQHIQVGQDRWENYSYDIDPEDHLIKQKVEGSFTQYPLKTAWAVTIHKAQGLTFDHVIIDAQAAFAYGQVYVALSRCRTLQGLVLSSPISKRNVFDNNDIDQFNASFTPPDQVSGMLKSCESAYYFDQLQELFDFTGVRDAVGSLNRLFRNHLQKLYPTQAQTIETMVQNEVPQLIAVGEKFQKQLNHLQQQVQGKLDDAFLQERISKAIAYFFDQMADMEEALQPILQVEVDSKATKALMQEAAEHYRDQLVLKRYTLEQLRLGGFSVESYNKAKVDYLLDQVDGENKESKKRRRVEQPNEKLSAEVVYGDVRHPQLVTLLTQWRRDQAAEENVAAYMVMHQRTLLAIANVLPLTVEALRSVPGMGKQKVQRYGVELTQLVAGFCREQGIGEEETQMLEFDVEENKAEEAAKKRAEGQYIEKHTAEENGNQGKEEDTKVQTWQISAQLFSEGNSVESIADQRHLTTQTVEGHLLQAFRADILDADQLLTEQEQDVLVNYILDNGPFEKTTQIFDHYEGRYSYFKIRVALAYADTLK